MNSKYKGAYFMKTRSILIKLPSLIFLVVISLILASPIVTAGDLVSKKYNFKPDTRLELGTSVNDIIIQSIKFKGPGAAKGKRFSITGSFKADVEIENKSKIDVKVGLALAIFDSKENLVGVGSGGSKMFFKIKAGDKKEYTVPFHYVTENLEAASTFQITLEIR
jgi:hypothetical protein